MPKAEGVLAAQTLVRTNKYLNNVIEQDHRMMITLDDLQAINRALVGQGAASRSRAAITMFEK